jgi:hypothetical protein
LPVRVLRLECGSPTLQGFCNVTEAHILTRQGIAAGINRHICHLRPVAPFVTAFLLLRADGRTELKVARIDCDFGDLTYCTIDASIKQNAKDLEKSAPIEQCGNLSQAPPTA